MTTKERNALQNLYNRLVNNAKKQSEVAFKGLQNLNSSLGNSKWCCAMQNFEEILKTTTDRKIIYQAEQLIREYQEANGMEQAYYELGNTLVELNFWKNKK